jgi:hypothetical protein
MALIHNGKKAPTLTRSLAPGEADTFYVSWEQDLEGDTIASSSWEIPADFTEVGTQTDIVVTEKGIDYANSNEILLSTTLTSGTHLIQNRIVTGSGRTLFGGFFLPVTEDK